MKNAFSDLHPWVNFAFFALTLAFSMIFMHPAYLAAMLIAAFFCHASLYGWRKTARTAAGMLPVFLVLSIVNPIFNRYGQRVLFTYFGRNYTLEALYYGMAIAAMFTGVLIWFSCYSAVMTSDKFVALFGGLMPSISLLLVLVFRLVPSYQRRAKAILGARGGVGMGVGQSANRREQIAQGMIVLSALTGWALESAITTADAMRSRGYGAAKRTSFQIYRFTLRDAAFAAIMGMLAAGCIAAAIMGAARAQYTPYLSIAPVHPAGFICYALFLLMPGAINCWEKIAWHISISRI